MKAFLYDLIKAPIITEKSNMLKSQNKYVFRVHNSSTKVSLKSAVENIFDVKVDKVNLINKKPIRRVFKGIRGKVSGFKKAIITLASGYSIEDFSGGVK
ncbi:MAG: 50S ribosomal protein L23 [Rickettsiaceae bacterium]|nr:50S ribosomal protein L23 [Rickettsiaceae bacterium]